MVNCLDLAHAATDQPGSAFRAGLKYSDSEQHFEGTGLDCLPMDGQRGAIF